MPLSPALCASRCATLAASGASPTHGSLSARAAQEEPAASQEATLAMFCTDREPAARMASYLSLSALAALARTCRSCRVLIQQLVRSAALARAAPVVTSACTLTLTNPAAGRLGRAGGRAVQP